MSTGRGSPVAYVIPGAALLIALPLLLLSLGAGTLGNPANCPGTETALGETGAIAIDVLDGLDTEQIRTAGLVVAAVHSFPATAEEPHAAVIALATARQESGIRNLPYGDRDSLGVFQQRPSQGWGTPAQILNVTHATQAFLERLVAIPHWRTIPVTDAAAQVQRPARENRGLYQQWVPLAEALIATLWTESTAPGAADHPPAAADLDLAPTPLTDDDIRDSVQHVDGGACPNVTFAANQTVVFPVPADLADTDQHNWGGHGDHWATWHTGTDFAVPCGTPVLAATAGTVEIENGPAWFGTWLVKIVTGPESVSTWYAHMQQLTVRPREVVEPGQQIGAAGALGNTTGCHLHFEVHLTNGSIYGPDNTDPSVWLATHVGTHPTGQGSTRIASFNVLGASHTAPGGNSTNHLDAASRMHMTVHALSDLAIDVVALQEFQPPQEETFEELTGDGWAHFPHSGGRPGAANVVAWRTDAWQLVAAQRVPVPYFGGTPVLMPYVLLENQAGQRVWVISVHNPADARGAAQQWRDQAVRIEAALVNRLAADGTPVVLAGDMNDRARFYCQITAAADLEAANGGTSSPECHPPTPMQIDWILGTPDVLFSAYRTTRAGDLERASDHPLVYADMSLP